MSDDLSYLNDVMHGNTNGTSTQSSSNGSTAAPISASTAIAELEPILAALKVNATSEDDLSQLDEESINSLLAKLNQAEGVTDGLEARLDSLLGELDGMLDGLKGLEGASIQRNHDAAGAGDAKGQHDQPEREKREDVSKEQEKS